jgi:hypothetical protein
MLNGFIKIVEFQGKYRFNYIPEFKFIPPNFEGKYKVDANFYFDDLMTDQMTYIATVNRYYVQ